MEAILSTIKVKIEVCATRPKPQTESRTAKRPAFGLMSVCLTRPTQIGKSDMADIQPGSLHAMEIRGGGLFAALGRFARNHARLIPLLFSQLRSVNQ